MPLGMIVLLHRIHTILYGGIEKDMELIKKYSEKIKSIFDNTTLNNSEVSDILDNVLNEYSLKQTTNKIEYPLNALQVLKQLPINHCEH